MCYLKYSLNLKEIDHGRFRVQRARENQEKTLVAGMKRGENESFRQFIEMYRHKMLSRARMFLDRKFAGEAEDVVQETFIKVFNNIHQFRDESDLFSWAIVILRNQCGDAIRKLKVRGADITHSYELLQCSRGSKVIKLEDKNAAKPFQAEFIELPAIITEVLKSLSSHHREIIFLTFYDKLSPQVVAERLGITESGARRRKLRALRRLRRSVVRNPRLRSYSNYPMQIQ